MTFAAGVLVGAWLTLAGTITLDRWRARQWRAGRPVLVPLWTIPATAGAVATVLVIGLLAGYGWARVEQVAARHEGAQAAAVDALRGVQDAVRGLWGKP